MRVTSTLDKRNEHDTRAQINYLISWLTLGVLLASQALAQSTEVPPPWAYPVNPPNMVAVPDDGLGRHVPGSGVTYTLSQLGDMFSVPDWHPEDHAAMPPIVAHGRKPEVFACGYCHRADGPGGPENAGIAGLPAAYIAQQIADFKSGRRQSSVPARRPVRLMISIANNLSDDEASEAAKYYSALKPRKIISVIETNSVPQTYVAGWFLAAKEGAVQEAIGQRIIEVPKDLEHFELRDSHSQFTAYVPTGSIARGRAMAITGDNSRTAKCATCHGLGLRGLGAVPGIAGRSPSYIVRQLYDFQHGTRAGLGSRSMRPVVAKLNLQDFIALAAYAASLKP